MERTAMSRKESTRAAVLERVALIASYAPHKDRLCRLGIVADRGKGNSHQYHIADGWRAIAKREGVDYLDPVDLGTSVAGEEEVSI